MDLPVEWSPVSHTAVLWEVMLDVKTMYAEAVQNPNSPVDHDTFWQTAIHCISIWLYNDLESWRTGICHFSCSILSCQEVGTFWLPELNLGRVPHTILLRMWSLQLQQRHPVSAIQCEENFVIIKLFRCFPLISVGQKSVFLLPMCKLKVCLEMVYWILFL